MKEKKSSPLTPDPWAALRTFTEARIGLGRCGTSLPLKESLNFRLAHARARDAVHQPVDFADLALRLQQVSIPSLQLSSAVRDRAEYLARPDLGRMLSDESRQLLAGQPAGYDIGLVVCDGLSAPALHTSALAVVRGFLDVVSTTSLTIAPVCLVKNGRVAIGDAICSLLKTTICVLLIGERPGLSSPNSLGAYLTHGPRPGTTDEARNCISNIRPGGLDTSQAVRKIAYLVEMAFTIGKTGTALKDTMQPNYLPMARLSKQNANSAPIVNPDRGHRAP